MRTRWRAARGRARGGRRAAHRRGRLRARTEAAARLAAGTSRRSGCADTPDGADRGRGRGRRGARRRSLRRAGGAGRARREAFGPRQAAAARRRAAAAEATEAALAAPRRRGPRRRGARRRRAAALAETDGAAQGAGAPRWRRWSGWWREAQAGAQVLDRLRVAPGYETALGAALADDLRAPAIGADGAGRAGWRCRAMTTRRRCRRASSRWRPLVTAPAVLARRLAQIGLVAARARAPRCRRRCGPGSGWSAVEGDLWRWDGFRAGAEDAPSRRGAAAAAAEPAGGAEARSGGGRGARPTARGAAHEAPPRRLAEAEAAERRRGRRGARRSRR